MVTPNPTGETRVNNDFQTPRADDPSVSEAKGDSNVVFENLSEEREERAMRANVKNIAVKRTMDDLRMIAQEVDDEAWMFRGPRSNP